MVKLWHYHHHKYHDTLTHSSVSCSKESQHTSILFKMCALLEYYNNLIQNSQAVKKVCGPQKGYGEKRCEIQGGGQEMAVMVG